MDSQAHVIVSIREGKIEISGSEAFVREQVDNFKDIIHKAIMVPANIGTTSIGETVQPGVPPAPPAGTENVIAFDGDKIKILKQIPGKNKAEKMVNAALIYLHGKNLKGEDVGLFKEISKVCRDHACYDPANFAAVLKKQKELFIVDGSGKSQTLKLTHPGKTQAATLVTELNVQ